MLPPVPPSPPLGGPFPMYFSRRKLMQPWPPEPACSTMEARSLKGVMKYESGGGSRRSSSLSCVSSKV